MTLLIAGCWQDRAILATDSHACGSIGDHAGQPYQYDKLRIFASSGVAAAGRGAAPFLDALMQPPSQSFDDLAAGMRRRFAEASEWILGWWKSPIDPTHGTYVISGWSSRRGTMAAHVFYQRNAKDGPIGTVISPGSAWFGPWHRDTMGPEPTLNDIATDDGLISAAIRQRDSLRSEGKPAGGPLVVARLDRQRITLERIYDLDLDMALPAA